MKTRKLTMGEILLLNTALAAEGFPEIANGQLTDMEVLEDVTGDDIGSAVLRYEANCDERDATLGVFAAYKAGLRVAFDGNSETVEFGIDTDTTPETMVVMARLPIWRE